MTILEIIFWFNVFAIFYAYFGYFCLLWLISIFKNDPVKKDNITPSVSLVISVFNEENVISQKIDNSLEIDYPKDLFEIAVVSDGSTDKTNEIIREYAKKDNRIRSCIVPANQGKTACLNDFVPQLQGEIILFSDANSFYPVDLIQNIVRPFADESVGFVTGSTKYHSSVKGEESRAISAYTRLEQITKSLESKIGSCVGADGAVFAIRKALFRPLRPADINDLVIPFNIIEQGYRGVLEEDAYCREASSGDMRGEFQRQVRITNRTLRAIINHNHLLNPIRYGLFSFELFSHKLMKLMGPFFMILFFISNCLVALQSVIYAVILLLQIIFYSSVYLAHRSNKFRNLNPIVSLAYTFTLTNVAKYHQTILDEKICPENVSVIRHDFNMHTWNEYIANARMVVIPIKKGTLQSAGISVYFEAMALGKPVVITEGVSTRGILTKEVAEIVPAADSEALAFAIEKLWENKEYRDRLAKIGKQFALSLEGAERMVKDILMGTYSFLEQSSA